MTNFEHIKNMDIDTLAMMIAMDRQRTVNLVYGFLKVEYKATSEFAAYEFEEIKKYLEKERE